MKTFARFVTVAAALVVGLTLLPLTLLAASGPSPTSTPATGTVEGRVQNEITGRYLNNSLVQVQGTELNALTDETGRFRIPHVPVGLVTLEVVYTGLERQKVLVNVAPGQVVTQNVTLAPASGSAVKMDAFLVATSKDMDQATIAINEQRFAPNIKTVVPTGDLAEHGDGNIAEFLKFAPGISGSEM